MPIVPIKTRTFTDPIDPELLLFIDARYIESYSGGLTVNNLAIGNVENTGDGKIVGNVTYDTEEGGCFIMNGGYIDFTPSSIDLGNGFGFGQGTNDLRVSIRDNYSVSFYVKPTRKIGSAFFIQSVFDTWASGSSDFNIGYGRPTGFDQVNQVATGNSEQFNFGSGIYAVVSPKIYPINNWYHVVWTKEAVITGTSLTHIYKLYVNGILEYVRGPSQNVSIDTKICCIGRGFRGKIAQVKVFDLVLTPNQVIKEFSSARVRLSSISTKKTPRDIILYLADNGNNAGWADNSIYSNGARILGNARFDGGLILPGTINNYAEGFLTLSPGSNFTISATIEPLGNGVQTGGLLSIFATNTASLNGGGFLMGYWDNTANLSNKNSLTFVIGDNAVINTNYKVTYNTKVTFTVTYNGSVFKLFVNGVLDRSFNSVKIFAYPANKVFRVGYYSSGGFERAFNGKIYNVILHNRTLSDTEVKELYHRMPTSYGAQESSRSRIPSYSRILYVDGAEPLSYYYKGGGVTQSGLTFSDISGYKRNGSLRRGYVIQSPNPGYSATGSYADFETWNSGYFSFNGFKTSNPNNSDQAGNSMISFSTPTFPDSSKPSTIIAWARAKDSPNTTLRYIFSYGTFDSNNLSGGKDRYIGIKNNGDGTGIYSVGTSKLSGGQLESNTMLTNKWFQIAFVHTGTQMRMFINGLIEIAKPLTLNTVTTTPLGATAYIGRSTTPVGTATVLDDGYFYGDIAQVVVYDRVLSDGEIYTHYQSTKDRFKLPSIGIPQRFGGITNPIVTTRPVPPASITSMSFVSGPILNFDGNATITNIGILLRQGIVSLPLQPGVFEFGSPDVGIFPIPDGDITNFTGLLASTNYQIRAYAYNGSFYGYGDILTVTTLAGAPFTVVVVSTSPTGVSVNATGQVTSLGSNPNYGERGFIWSTSTITNPASITTNRFTDTGPWTSITEQWSYTIPTALNLIPNTTYYIMSYAKYLTTTVYSTETTFTTYTFATVTIVNPSSTDIGSNSVTITGNVTSVGNGGPVTKRGIIYSSTELNPDLDNSAETEEIGSFGTGTFTGTITGLTPGQTLYVRAYAITSAGVAYSTNTLTILTDSAPSVTTNDITYTDLSELFNTGGPPELKQTATASGTINNNNGSTVTQVGFVWNTTGGTLDINTNAGKVSTNTVTNNFRLKLVPDLTRNTLYYFKAYATNAVNTGYGAMKQFKTLYKPTVLRVSSPSELNGTPAGSVTLRARVDPTLFGNSDYYNQPLIVGFYYAKPTDLTYTQFIVGEYTKANADALTPFTANLTFQTGIVYTILAFARQKGTVSNGQPGDVDGEGVSTTYQVTAPAAATVDTQIQTAVSYDRVTMNGDITNNGGATITERGFVWKIFNASNPNPVLTIDSSVIVSGTVLPFSSVVTNLTEGQAYNYRAYAINSVGTSYGDTITFTLNARVDVTTNPADIITTTGGRLRGTAGSNLGGYGDIDEVGFFWSSNQSLLPSQPAVGVQTITTTSTKVPTNTNVAANFAFSTALTGLTFNTIYYFVAYTKNPAGFKIGSVQSFTTQNITVPTVTLGTIGTTTTTGVAISNSNVTNANNGTITAKGVVWSTSGTPVLPSTNKTTDGSGIGQFTSNISGLASNQLYYVRAYATNEAGTGYSTNAPNTFTTQAVGTLPTVGLSNLVNREIDTGEDPIEINFSISLNTITGLPTQVGALWSTNTTPTLSNDDGFQSVATSTNNSVNIQVNYPNTTTGSLALQTKYFVRGFATNGTGTGYSTAILEFYTANFGISNVYQSTDPGKNNLRISYFIQLWGGLQSAGASKLELFISTSPLTLPLNSPPAPIPITNPATNLAFAPGGAYPETTTTYFRLRITFYESQLNVYELYSNMWAASPLGPIIGGARTGDPSNITTTTAQIINSEVESDGGGTITQAGVVWNTSPNPDITFYNGLTIDTNQVGLYDSNLTGLQPNTTYYVTAYVTNEAGTAYGTSKVITTLPAPPSITTTAANNIFSRSFSSGGNITSDGGSTITSRGIVWSITNTPTSPSSAYGSSNKTSDGADIGTFTSTAENVLPSATYYVWAYAVNANGVYFSTNPVTVTTSPLTISISLWPGVESGLPLPTGATDYQSPVSSFTGNSVVVPFIATIPPNSGYIYLGWVAKINTFSNINLSSYDKKSTSEDLWNSNDTSYPISFNFTLGDGGFGGTPDWSSGNWYLRAYFYTFAQPNIIYYSDPYRVVVPKMILSAQITANNTINYTSVIDPVPSEVTIIDKGFVCTGNRYPNRFFPSWETNDNLYISMGTGPGTITFQTSLPPEADRKRVCTYITINVGGITWLWFDYGNGASY